MTFQAADHVMGTGIIILGVNALMASWTMVEVVMTFKVG